MTTQPLTLEIQLPDNVVALDVDNFECEDGCRAQDCSDYRPDCLETYAVREADGSLRMVYDGGEDLVRYETPGHWAIHFNGGSSTCIPFICEGTDGEIHWVVEEGFTRIEHFTDEEHCCTRDRDELFRYATLVNRPYSPHCYPNPIYAYPRQR